MDWDKFSLIYDWEFENICDSQKDDIIFWQRFAADSGKNILELGAGSGRITIPLLKNGYNITALDYSAKMLQILSHKYSPIKNGGELNVLTADMKDFSLQQIFDACFLSYSSFQHLIHRSDQIKCLLNINHHLKLDGTVGFDLDADILHYPPNLSERRVYTLYNKDLDADVTLFTSWISDEIEQVRHWQDRYIINNGSEVQELTNHIALKALSRNQIENLLKETGFEIKKIEGGFMSETFNSNSERILVTARKIANM